MACLYRFPGSIESYFGNGRRWGVKIQYVLLKEAWGNAGALHWAKTLITEDFIVVPADAMVDLNIGAAFDDHRTQKNITTVVVTDTVDGDDNIIHLDGVNHNLRNKLQLHSEKIHYETGVYLFEPQALDFIPARSKLDIHTHLLPALTAAGLTVGMSVMTGYWNRLESFHDFRSILLQLPPCNKWPESQQCPIFNSPEIDSCRNIDKILYTLSARAHLSVEAKNDSDLKTLVMEAKDILFKEVFSRLNTREIIETEVEAPKRHYDRILL